MDLKSGDISTLTEDGNVTEITWLGKNSAIIYLRTSEETKGGLDVFVSDTKDFDNGYVIHLEMFANGDFSLKELMVTVTKSVP